MSIASRITSIEEHIGDIYDTLTLGGADLTGVNKNLANVTSQLKDRYLDFMNNGTWSIWNNCEKVTGEGTSLSLSPTIQAPMRNNLKGNTSQTGTPTPSLPVDVNVVSGNNEINVCGKNLFKNLPYTTTYYDITMTNDGEKITFSGTNSSSTYYPSFIFYADGSVETTQWYASASNIKPNKGYFTKDSTEYIISLLKSGTLDKTYCEILIGRESTVNSAHFNNTSTTYTTTIGSSTAKVNFIAIGFQASQTVNLTFNFQIEKGSSPTTYEPYIGNTYNIDLPVENLFSTTVIQGAVDTNSVATSTTRLRTNDFIKVQPSTTYICSFSGNASDYDVHCFTTNSFPRASEIGWKTNTSFTTPANCNYIMITFRKSDNSTITTSDIQNIQLELGSKANAYTPYGTTPIELCKIGNYQDYIYKDSDKWYLHKEIGKVVLNGNETWAKVRDYVFTNKFDNCLYPTSPNVLMDCLCNNFTRVSNSATWNNYDSLISYYTQTGGATTVFRYNQTKEKSDFTNWLSTHNTIVYFVLATPTNTEITYLPLIYQLEAWYQAKSKNGQTNISQINNDLPFIINSTMLKEV